MFQPEVKLEFVRRYCSPADGWEVFVDIDASEEGRTGGSRKSDNAKRVQEQMQTNGRRVREEFGKLGAQVGGSREGWFDANKLPTVKGDRDIVAFNRERKVCRIVEVEGTSSGQPEQKLYKAIGQIVMAASTAEVKGWKRELVLVVYGDKMGTHLNQAKALRNLDVSGLVLGKHKAEDRWVIGRELSSKLAAVGL